ncbi:uncharacterized protein BCR38DRAFT_422529 [Pseudomassariella vexata]|uniref:Uncharacterized protein n=1 Tax=Pseudomassariella vexata TaxID=1141098 RepID=A0A1Y2E9M1_9PEZI|nr:uncharacterized protein BCR38DRAFT_422529 [Pseudomassariella vexata]ORY68242.1 hypothetical protein BCR38DRAFT_422529 [Pseudomassariella vexata]
MDSLRKRPRNRRHPVAMLRHCIYLLLGCYGTQCASHRRQMVSSVSRQTSSLFSWRPGA